MEGAKHRKSNLFNSDDIYSIETVTEKQREIDTDYGKAFVDSVLKNLEKELVQYRLSELWEDHCKNPETPDYQKTDSYRKEFERFYNAGRKHMHLLPKVEGQNRDYRPFVKEVFKEIFQYAEAGILGDHILEELVTNCNQAGYGAGIFIEYYAALSSYGLTPRDPEKVMNINYIDCNNIKVKSDMKIPVTKFNNPEEKICDLSTSLEFTLESQDGKDGVIYKNGKLSLTVPKELKNYKEGSRNLFDVIKEYFQKFCEKLGLKLETKTQIEHDLDNSLKVNSHLESLKPLVYSNNHVISH